MKNTIWYFAAMLVAFSNMTTAAPVTYVIKGTMEYYSPISFGAQNFEGSTMEWRLTTDTEAVPYEVVPAGGGSMLARYSYEDAVIDSVVTFKNRPNGLNDLTTGTYENSTSDEFFYIVNYGDGVVGQSDVFYIQSRNVTTDSLYVEMPAYQIVLFFNRDFYADGEIPGPPKFSDDELIGQYFNYSGSSEEYILTNASISSVPIPAAAWLFGSALLGLVAVKRKKP